MSAAPRTTDASVGAASSGAARGPLSRARGPLSRASWVFCLVTAVGLVLTVSASLTARRLDSNSEHRLLEVQTRQAAAVVSSAIIGIEAPLKTAAAIGAASNGDPAAFRNFMSSYIGPKSLFIAAQLWRSGDASSGPVASVGVTPALDPAGDTARAMRSKASTSATFVVEGISVAGQKRIAYALGTQGRPSYVVVAERGIPANRRVPVESTSAFSDLHFATYLGKSTATADMQTTDVDVRRLPLRGTVVVETIPFGNTFITLATSPSTHLGGTLGVELPWILLVGGLLLTLITALITAALVRRRSRAEADANTIIALYEQLDELYGVQRSISETLQHALLPQSNPAISGLEIASRYVAGARGVEVGGDWYSLIGLDENRFAFVVGDVSGRGVEAAALMGRIRFTLRAYLVEGHPPEVALGLCSREVNVLRDGHIATALVGVGDLSTGVITLANAGHLGPLLVTESEARFITTSVGLPLGVRVSTYQTTQMTLPYGATLIAYTDGLVERRGEPLSQGLDRLADNAPVEGALDERLDRLISALSQADSEDDIAVLAFRRLPQAQAARESTASSA
ncbi:serine/threonine-protein phosphatase [Jatrophihabitans telluris]|uniref:Serine/threonine-protein phosphatase n=1 Tax=Jatrophihabitans telluris TaxID=2038343 RepID=A0ABY4QZJ2_9ACTN|nr:PP2C family protein-serine/threonine phosphatase [Jatrophihabitans telluris]UQX89014.1 serine/threonine-protein phosphatase [Jatrophihabitans telluris]